LHRFERKAPIKGQAPVLILARNAGEVTRIGDDVKVIVLAIKGHEVRPGIVVPSDVIVDREEVAERKRRERDEISR
jgi:carbon storage regulator